MDDGPSPGNGTASDLYAVTGRVVDDDGGWAPLVRPVGPRIANDDNDTGWSVTQQIQVGEPIGQTFTAISDNPLSTISFYVADMNASVAPTDYSLTFELYEGVGTSGRLLGRRRVHRPVGRLLRVHLGGLQFGDAGRRPDVHGGAGQRHGALGPGGVRQPVRGRDGDLRRRAQPDGRRACSSSSGSRIGQPPRIANDDNDTGWSVTQQIQVGEPIGQTFTAISDNRLATISFYVADMNASRGADGLLDRRSSCTKAWGPAGGCWERASTRG